MHQFHFGLRCALSAAVLLGLSTGFCAAQYQVRLSPETDTWISKNDMANRSAYTSLNVAGVSQAGLQPQESALLRFDLGALHRHDWVDAAEVELNVPTAAWIDVWNEAGVGLFPVNRDWTPSATWSMYDPSQGDYWAAAGCEGGGFDRDLSPDDVVAFHDTSGAGEYVWSGSDLTQTVQDWHRGARTNDGWLARLYGGIYQSGKTDRVQFQGLRI